MKLLLITKIQSRAASTAADELLIQLIQLISACRFQDAYMVLTNELNELNENELFDRLYRYKKIRLSLQRCAEETSDIRSLSIKDSIKLLSSFPKIIKLHCNAFILKNFYRVDLTQERSTS